MTHISSNKFKLAFSFVILMGLLVSCTAPTQPPPVQPTIPSASTSQDKIGTGHWVAVVFAYPGLGDKTYNDSLFQAMSVLADQLGFNWDYVEPQSASEYEPLIRTYAEAKKYDLIISLGYSQGSSLTAVAPNYPNQKFMIMDAPVDQPNVAAYTWRENEVSYMVGIVAGAMTKSNKIGFVGGMDIPSVNSNAAGLIAGVRSVNPNAEVLIDYLGAWDNIAGGKEMALAMYQKGTDVIYHAASLSGLGILQAGKEKGFYTVGFDGNVNGLAPDTNILSAIRDFKVACKIAITDAIQGTFKGGSKVVGAKEDALYITNTGSNVKIPDDIWAKVTKAEEEMSSGTLLVPATLDEVNK